MLDKNSLHKYQHRTVTHIKENPFAGVILDMGLGKTVSTLTAINELIYEDMELETVLVVAPKKVVESVWTQEAKNWAHLKHLRIESITGSRVQRLTAIKTKADIHLISRDNIAWLCGEFGGSSLPWSMLVLDESSSFKSPKSNRFKALKKVQPCFHRVVLLTGTFAPNGLIDLWAQMFLLDRGERLGKTITAYRDKYFKPNQRNGMTVFNYKLRDGEQEEAIHAKIKDVCISMKATDYLDMPDLVNNYIRLDMDEALKKQYKDFEQQQVLELIEGGEVTAMNAAALSNKLLQFANGAVYDEKREVHHVHDLKIEALKEVIDNNNGKPVLVAWAYQHDRDRILEGLKKYKPVQLKTDAEVVSWNKGEIEVLTMHPASGGHGLNLQAGGSTVVWFGQTWNLELYQQLNTRLYRQGQTSKSVVIHHLLTGGTLDEKVIDRQEGKASKQDALMKAIKDIVKGMPK